MLLVSVVISLPSSLPLVPNCFVQIVLPLESNLITKHIAKEVIYYTNIDSTNDELWLLCKNNNNPNRKFIVITDNQNQGRGRGTNQWWRCRIREFYLNWRNFRFWKRTIIQTICFCRCWIWNCCIFFNRWNFGWTYWCLWTI